MLQVEMNLELKKWSLICLTKASPWYHENRKCVSKAKCVPIPSVHDRYSKVAAHLNLSSTSSIYSHLLHKKKIDHEPWQCKNTTNTIIFSPRFFLEEYFAILIENTALNHNWWEYNWVQGNFQGSLMKCWGGGG